MVETTEAVATSLLSEDPRVPRRVEIVSMAVLRRPISAWAVDWSVLSALVATDWPEPVALRLRPTALSDAVAMVIVSEALFPVPTWILRLTPAEPKITRPLKAVVSLMRLTSRRISWYSLFRAVFAEEPKLPEVSEAACSASVTARWSRFEIWERAPSAT